MFAPRVRLYLRKLAAFVIATFLLSSHSFADDLPDIARHSVNEPLTINAGDIVQLEVEAAGEGNEYVWMTRDKPLCRESKCVVKTKDWGPGKYTVIIAVRNSSGARYLRYELFVKPLGDEDEPATHTPEVVDAAAGEEGISNTDFYIRSLTGLGFARSSGGARIIESLPQKLNWDEDLKSSVGILQFGVLGGQEHFLLSGSQAQLTLTEDKKRRIALTKGVLRTRNLGEDVHWEVVVRESIVITGDSTSDIIVSAKSSSESVSVISIRGYAVISAGGQKIVVSPGTMVVAEGASSKSKGKADGEAPGEKKPSLALAAKPLKLLAPESKMVYRALELTTPFYLRPKAWQTLKEGSGATGKKKKSSVLPTKYTTSRILKQGSIPQSLADAKKGAAEALAKDDPLLALENLFYYYDPKAPDFEILYSLGIAYQRLNLFKRSATFFRQAIKLQPSNPDVYFRLGVLNLTFSRWKNAALLLQKAQSFEHPNQQLISYYLGYSYLRLGKNQEAKQSFAKSLWHQGDSDVAESAKTFLRSASNNKDWELTLDVDLFHDNNVFQTNDGDLLGEQKTNSSWGSRIGAGIWRHFFATQNARISAGYKALHNIYFAAGLKNVTSNSQYIMGRVYLHSAEELSDSWFSLDGTVFINSIAVGDKRAVDGVGGELLVGVPTIWGSPTFVLKRSRYVDPLPGEDDIIDPFTFELAQPSDRSASEAINGLQFTNGEQNQNVWTAKVLALSRQHANVLVKDEDHNETRVSFDYLWKISWSYHFFVRSLYVMRTFPNDSDSRSDKMMGLALGNTWNLSPTWSMRAHFEKNSQQSTQSVGKFDENRWVFGLGLAL